MMSSVLKKSFRLLNHNGKIEPLNPNYKGEVASRYKYKDFEGESKIYHFNFRRFIGLFPACIFP